MRARLKQTLSAHRYAHTLGVVETAAQLAERYGVDQKQAYTAALLHDCAKGLPFETMRALVREGGVFADEIELATPQILHAPAGACLAARDYGVRDGQILSAIRRHTIGGKDITKLEALIYVSDFIEPTREAFPGLLEARALAETNLWAALRDCAQKSVAYVQARGEKAHPATIQMVKDMEGCT